VQHSTTLLLLE